MAFLRVPQGRAVWRTSKARRVLEALGKMECGLGHCRWGTLSDLCKILNRPADDVLHDLKPLIAGGLVLKWNIYQGDGKAQKIVGIGVSIVSDPNRPLKTDNGYGDHSNRVVTETSGGLPVPIDRMEDAVTTGSELRQSPMAGCAPPPPLDAAERDRTALRRWMAAEGAFAELAREAVIPEGVPYPTLLIGEGMVWGRARALPCGEDQRRPEPLDPGTVRTPQPVMTVPEAKQEACPAGHGPTLGRKVVDPETGAIRHEGGRSHYCIVCDRSGSGQDLIGSTPVVPRPGRVLRRYAGEKGTGGAKAGKKSKKKGRKEVAA